MSMYFELYLDGDQLLCSSEINEGILDLKVDKEINKAGSCTFIVLPSHSKWDQFYRMKTRIDLYVRGKNIFRGRVNEVSVDNYKQKTITCEGALAWFVDSYIPKLETLNIKTQFVYPLLLNAQITNNHNNRLESYKSFTVGIGEPTCYAGKLNPTGSNRTGWTISGLDGKTYIENENKIMEIEYIPFDREMTYVVYGESFGQMQGDYANNCVFYMYGKAPDYEFKGIWLSHALTGQTLIDYGGKTSEQVDEIKYIRVSADLCSMFWITYYDPETEGSEAADKDEVGWDGGQMSDFLTNWIVDNQHSLMRSRVSENGDNLIDVLHPKRNVYSTTIEFTKNVLDLSTESTDDEPYSIIVPLFDGKVDSALNLEFSNDCEIPAAKELYGRIYKSIEFGKSVPSTTKEKKKFLDKINKYKKLYDPTIPNQFQIKALDDGIIFDNDELTIIDVGDPVRVVSEFHNIDLVLLCLNMSLDIFSPENNSYKIGKYVQSDTDFRIEALTESFVKEKKKRKSSS